MGCIFIVNGYPTAGKTTFVEYCKEILKKPRKNNINNIITASVVDSIKIIADSLGWDGIKDEKGRKFLSDIKEAMDDYSDFTHVNFKHIFMGLKDNDFLFVDMRSPHDIEWATKNYSAHSIFIKKEELDQKEYGNIADKNVNNYKYELYIDNNGTLEDLYNSAEQFINEILDTLNH